MNKLKNRKSIILFLITTLLSSFYLTGQTKDSIISVHPLLGERIDATEKKIHNLFPNYTKFKFDYAEFHLFGNGTIFLFVTQKKPTFVDTVYYTEYQFNSLREEIEKYYEIKLDDTLKTWDYPYMKWHYFIATRGKYKDNTERYENTFASSDYKAITNSYKSDGVTPLFAGKPEAINNSTLPLFSIDYTISKRLQIGIEYTKMQIDFSCGKDTGNKHNTSIELYREYTGHLATTKLNYRLVPYQEKKRRFELSTGIGIITNYIKVKEEIKTSIITNQNSGNAIYSGDETTYAKLTFGVHSYLRTDFYLTKNISLFARFSVPANFGLRLEQRNINAFGSTFKIPYQNVNFSGFKLNFGIALHFLERNKLQHKKL